MCVTMMAASASDQTFFQEAYLKASNTGAGDFFGWAVAISGNTAVVGAYGKNEDYGAAYVFVRSGTVWHQQAYLTASDASDDDRFGRSVAIDGDTIVVGASFEDDVWPNSGAAYVFVRNGTAWFQQAKLKASNAGTSDFFGTSVALSGNTIIVGAAEEDSSATSVNGNQSSNSASESGAAYVFVRDGTNWTQQAYLKAFNTDAYDFFGTSVSVASNSVVVGAVEESSNATGVNGNQDDNSASRSGAAYVFVRSGTNWSQQAYLKASNTGENDLFGQSVSISSDAVVVGAIGEDSLSGASYVFIRTGTNWAQQAYLKAMNSGGSDAFGQSVAIDGDTIVVGAIQEDEGAYNSGAAYVYKCSGTNWTQRAYLKASNTDSGDQFGQSVAISGDTIVIGADKESSNASGVNGNQSDNSALDAGAVYVFYGVGAEGYSGTITNHVSALGEFSLEWETIDGFYAVVKHTPDLINEPFADISSAIPCPQNSYCDNVYSDGSQGYYRVQLYAIGEEGIGGTISNVAWTGDGLMIEWEPIDGYDSVIKYTPDLANESFTNVLVVLPYPQNSYTDTVHSAGSQGFYRVQLSP